MTLQKTRDILRAMEKTDIENKVGLRERKQTRQREIIINTCLDLFLTNGYERTTISEITDKIDISKRTFFRYFETKEDVVLASYDKLINSACISIKTSSNNNPAYTLQNIYINFAKLYEDNKKYFLKIEKLISETPSIRAKKTDKILECAREIGNKLLKYDQIEPIESFKNNLLINYSMGTFLAAVDVWVMCDGEVGLSSFIDRGFKLIEDKAIELLPSHCNNLASS